MGCGVIPAADENDLSFCGRHLRIWDSQVRLFEMIGELCSQRNKIVDAIAPTI